MDHFYQSVSGWFESLDLFSFVVNKYDQAHFVEVGSWKGRSSCCMAVEIINSKKSIKFDCVDLWEYSDSQNDISSNEFEGVYGEFISNISKVAHYINPVKSTSVEASKLYLDASLDFVFIDAAHDYENVKKDIEAWLPKMKSGGIISGHDYFFSQGVRRAVHEILGEVHTTSESWYKEV